MTTVIAHQGDTVDLICWRHHGRTAGITEAVLVANPRLASHGLQLPEGTPVQLPDNAPQQQTRTVQLWD